MVFSPSGTLEIFFALRLCRAIQQFQMMSLWSSEQYSTLVLTNSAYTFFNGVVGAS
jgi:hypothetical protein